MNKRNPISIIILIIVGILLFAIVAWAIIPNAPFKNQIKEFTNNASSFQSNSNAINSNASDSPDYETETNGTQQSDRISVPIASSYSIEASVGDVSINAVHNNNKPMVTVTSEKELISNINVGVQIGDTVTIKIEGKGIDTLVFNKIKINIDLPDEDFKSFDIKLGAGKLNVNNISAEQFTSNITAGELTVKDCDFKRIDTSLFAGSSTLYLDDDVTAMTSTVMAGQFKVYVPQNIDGFRFQYSVAAGNLVVDKTFTTDNKVSSYNVGKTGSILYKNGAAQLVLNMTTGNVEILKYNQ